VSLADRRHVKTSSYHFWVVAIVLPTMRGDFEDLLFSQPGLISISKCAIRNTL